MKCRLATDDRLRVSLTVLVLFGLCCLAQSQPTFRKKFEYKLSFKGPHLVQKDGTIPFWEHFGSTLSFLTMPYVIEYGEFVTGKFRKSDSDNTRFTCRFM